MSLVYFHFGHIPGESFYRTDWSRSPDNIGILTFEALPLTITILEPLRRKETNKLRELPKEEIDLFKQEDLKVK